MKVSVITPSFNQGQFILRTLESVQKQAISGLVHVVMDGKSTDQTVEVLKHAAQTMPHLTWISEKDGGQAHAVNKGILATTGEIIGWLNSDDVYYPQAIESVLEIFQKHPDVDVVYGMADHIDINDQPFEPYPSEPWDEGRLKSICFICQPALFFRRRVVEQYGLLDESLNYCMDYEYWLRLAQQQVRFYYLEKKLAGSRLYNETKTLGARVKVHAEINDMFKHKFGQVPDKWILNYAHVLVEQTIDHHTRPRTYFLSVMIRTLMASLYWNRKITFSLTHTMLRWINARIPTPFSKKAKA